MFEKTKKRNTHHFKSKRVLGAPSRKSYFVFNNIFICNAKSLYWQCLQHQFPQKSTFVVGIIC